jgi:hypothetical protein
MFSHVCLILVFSLLPRSAEVTLLPRPHRPQTTATHPRIRLPGMKVFNSIASRFGRENLEGNPMIASKVRV